MVLSGIPSTCNNEVKGSSIALAEPALFAPESPLDPLRAAARAVVALVPTIPTGRFVASPHSLAVWTPAVKRQSRSVWIYETRPVAHQALLVTIEVGNEPDAMAGEAFAGPETSRALSGAATTWTTSDQVPPGTLARRADAVHAACRIAEHEQVVPSSACVMGLPCALSPAVARPAYLEPPQPVTGLALGLLARYQDLHAAIHAMCLLQALGNLEVGATAGTYCGYELDFGHDLIP